MACCEEYSRLISLYPLSEDQTPEERAKLEAHIQECAACRADLEHWREFLNLIRPPKDAGVPQWVKGSVQANVMKAIRRNTRIQETMRIGKVAVAVAAAGLTIVLLIHKQHQDTAEHAGHEAVANSRHATCETASTDTDAAPTHPLHASPSAGPTRKQENIEDKLTEFTSAAEAFAWMEQAVSSRDATFEENALQDLVDRFTSRWPETPESVEALKLLARCHEQMALPNEARRTLVSYATAAGRQRARDGDPNDFEESAHNIAAHVLCREANRVFSAGGALEAMDYYQAVISEYPETEPARFAHLMVARCFLSLGKPEEAFAVYEKVISSFPNSYIAQRARMLLASRLLLMRKRNLALKQIMDYVEYAQDADEASFGYFRAGEVLAACGNEHLVDAMQMYRKVVAEYPGCQYALAANLRLRQMATSVPDDVIEDILE